MDDNELDQLRELAERSRNTARSVDEDDWDSMFGDEPDQNEPAALRNQVHVNPALLQQQQQHQQAQNLFPPLYHQAGHDGNQAVEMPQMPQMLPYAPPVVQQNEPGPSNAQLQSQLTELANLIKTRQNQPSTSSALVPAENLKRKGYQVQVQFNNKITGMIEEAKSLAQTEKDKKLDDIAKALKQRSTLISLADGNPEFMGLMDQKEEYERVKAVDPEMATMMLKARKQEQKSKLFRHREEPRPRSSQTPYRSEFYRQSSSYARQNSRKRLSRSPSRSQKDVECYICHKKGHYATTCNNKRV